MSTDFATFINWEKSSRDSIDVKKIYIDMAGDLVAGILLSQIIYWYLPSKETGKSKISIIRDNKEWIAKNRSEWWDEIRISPKQFDRAIKELVKVGIIETKLYWFGKSPTKHIRIVKDVFIQLWNSLVIDPIEPSILPKGQNTNEGVFSPKGKMDFTQTSKCYIPESTSIDKELTTPDKPDVAPLPAEPEIVKPKRQRKPDPLYDAIALVWKTDAGGYVGNMKSMLLGTAKKGEWQKCNFDTPATPEEVIDFGRWWKRTHPGLELSKPETIQRRFYEYRAVIARKAAQPKIVAIVTDPAWHKPTDDYYDLANGNGQKPESA